MIFVSTGTVPFPFRRLIDEVIHLYENSQTDVAIQSGAYMVTSPKKNITVQSYLPLAQMIEHYKKAQLVITAAGEMSAYMACLYSKKLPILVPRLQRFGEHVDDQQVAIASYFAKNGLARMVTDISQLGKAISSSNSTKKITTKKYDLALHEKNVVDYLNSICAEL